MGPHAHAARIPLAKHRLGGQAEAVPRQAPVPIHNRVPLPGGLAGHPLAAPTCQGPDRLLRRVAMGQALLRLVLALALVLLPVQLLLPAPLRAEFSGVDYTLTNQNGGDFSRQDLAHTSFAGAQGRGASFQGADLHGAILTQGAFPEADFRDADLSDVLMDKVDFAGADFSGALLRGVIASGSSFRGARVDGADFSDALLDRDDIRALCREAGGINPITGIETRLSLGCG